MRSIDFIYFCFNLELPNELNANASTQLLEENVLNQDSELSNLEKKNLLINSNTIESLSCSNAADVAISGTPTNFNTQNKFNISPESNLNYDNFTNNNNQSDDDKVAADKLVEVSAENEMNKSDYYRNSVAVSHREAAKLKNNELDVIGKFNLIYLYIFISKKFFI